MPIFIKSCIRNIAFFNLTLQSLLLLFHHHTGGTYDESYLWTKYNKNIIKTKTLTTTIWQQIQEAPTNSFKWLIFYVLLLKGISIIIFLLETKYVFYVVGRWYIFTSKEIL